MIKINHFKTVSFFLRIRYKLWNILFSGNFKEFGESSYIIKPRAIQNPEYFTIKKNVALYHDSRLITMKALAQNPELTIDDNTTIYYNVTISAVKKVYIGKYVLMAERVYISDNSHGFKDVTVPIKLQPIQFLREVFIGDNTWIGENACILGARIGKHCVIGANSVVTKDIPDYCVAVGLPAKILKKYNPKNNQWEKVN